MGQFVALVQVCVTFAMNTALLVLVLETDAADAACGQGKAGQGDLARRVQDPAADSGYVTQS